LDFGNRTLLLKKMANPNFEKSLTLNLLNVNTRIKLVDIYTALYKNKAALKQLDYLNDSSQINFDKRLQLARFNMLAGNISKANELLKKADAIHPYILPEIHNLDGLLNMLSKKNQESISAYKKSLQVQQADPWFNNYTIARLYAKNGNTKEAWKHLNSAVELGFNYSYILQYVSYMANLRKTEKWHPWKGRSHACKSIIYLYRNKAGYIMAERPGFER